MKSSAGGPSGARPSAIAVVATMLAAIGLGSIVLQREVAGTITAALLLSVVWGGIVAVGFIAYAKPRALLLPVLTGLGAAALLGGAGYYWFSVRDSEIDEDVVVAKDMARGAAAQQALAGRSSTDPGSGGPPRNRTRNVTLARGEFVGADGHDGTGMAKVIRKADGGRVITFTEFDVDPGAAVEVWLTTGESSTEPRVELGSLKGNVGDQQYKVPTGADLTRFSTVMLYCTPFTVRIAYADLDIG